MKNIHMHVMFYLSIVQEEAQAMIREADLNGDGRVDYKGKTFSSDFFILRISDVRSVCARQLYACNYSSIICFDHTYIIWLK